MRSLSLLFLALAACPAPEKPAEASLARFADASAEERESAVQTAMGFGAVWATMVQMQADNDARSVDENNEPSGCPAYDVLAEEPLTVRYEADGCTGPSGATWDGLLEVENPLTWEDAYEEPSGAMAMVADGFTMSQGGAVFTFDGTWSQSTTEMGVDGTSTIDLAATIGGRVWHLQGDMNLGWDGDVSHSTCGEGLRGEVSGLGAFAVACDVIGLGTEDAGGYVELRGEDTLRVEMTPDADGCLPATIDGVVTEPLCMGGEDPESGELDSDVFGMGGIGSYDDFVSADIQTLAGEADRVDVALSVGDTVEVHPLPADPEWSNEEYDTWNVVLETGDYEAGVSTTFTWEDFDTMIAVFFAYDADGELIGCMVNAWGTDTGAVDVSACPTK